MPPPDAIMKVVEVAEYLKVHRITVYRMVRKHQIPAFKIGTEVRFHRDAIEKWMTDRTSEALKKSDAAVRAAQKKTGMH